MKGVLAELSCTVLLLQIAAPIGVETTRRLNAPTEGTPNYRFKGSSGLNTSTLSSYDPAWGLDASKSLTCSMVSQDLPTGTQHSEPDEYLSISEGMMSWAAMQH